MLKKILVVSLLILAILVIGYILLTCSASEGCGGCISKKATEIELYPVVTQSKIYYAQFAEKENTETCIYNYYTKVGDKWVYREGKMILTESFGEVTIMPKQKVKLK